MSDNSKAQSMLLVEVFGQLPPTPENCERLIEGMFGMELEEAHATLARCLFALARTAIAEFEKEKV
jgi:hypothetical protein